ncbi:tetratricopeptide repeat protein [Oceanobacillus salinisoli]|uniref:tetratricopeptide repeat protein n=1 Tax=Oceanobacillus salinisoli TaxID=2678611 RepID=UPI0012E24F9B|nr:hypothetical protein [Oceanobacillus salinisoli]
MNKNQFQAKVNKKQLTLTVEKLIVYKQTKIIEATDHQSNFYYAVFFKNHFVNGVKANQIRLNSYIHQACKHGICYDRIHPFITHLVHDKTFHFTKFNQLIKSLPKQYSSKEIAFIFLFFNSFTKQGSSRKLFKNTFYDYRRNGKDFTAYQALKYYSNYNPSNKFVFDMLHNLQFQRYEKHYNDLNTLYEKDPDYAELVCFDNRYDPAFSQILFQLYRDQHRSLDEIAVRLDLLKHQFTMANFQELKELIKNFPLHDQIRILGDLIDTDHSANITEELFSLLLDGGEPNDIAQFILTNDIQPQEKQLPLLIEKLEKADTSVLVSNFESSNKRLLTISNHNKITLEKLVTPFVSAFFDEYSLNKIMEWFAPFQQANIHLSLEQKLKKMKKLTNDPDRQFALGEMYLDFQQLEKSIDCFKWEMEMNPEDPKPVNYLSKIYAEMGNREEAKAYQQLMVQMNK